MNRLLRLTAAGAAIAVASGTVPAVSGSAASGSAASGSAVSGSAVSGSAPRGSTASATAATTRPGPAHLLVYAQEWSLWPSSGSVRAGTIDVELWNRGQDAHDLRIRHLNGAGVMFGRVDGTMQVTPAGAISHAVWHLKAGRYEIYCSLPGHLAMGMHTNITVRRGS